MCTKVVTPPFYRRAWIVIQKNRPVNRTICLGTWRPCVRRLGTVRVTKLSHKAASLDASTSLYDSMPLRTPAPRLSRDRRETLKSRQHALGGKPILKPVFERPGLGGLDSPAGGCLLFYPSNINTGPSRRTELGASMVVPRQRASPLNQAMNSSRRYRCPKSLKLIE